MLSFLSKGEGECNASSPNHRLCCQLVGADEIILAVIPILSLNLHIVQAGARLNRLVCGPDVSLHPPPLRSTISKNWLDFPDGLIERT